MNVAGIFFGVGGGCWLALLTPSHKDALIIAPRFPTVIRIGWLKEASAAGADELCRRHHVEDDQISHPTFPPSFLPSFV